METKKCPECGSEMHKDISPKISSQASPDNKIPTQVDVWRCNNCRHTEAYD